MLKLFLALATLLSAAGFVVAAPIPAPTPQEVPTGGNNGPNGTSLIDPITGLLLDPATEPTGDDNGPGGTILLPGESAMSNGPNGTR